MRDSLKSLLVAVPLVLPLPAAAGCWSSGDKADLAFDELGGTTTLSFRDAVTCAPLDGARVAIDGQALRTNPLGEVRLDTSGMMDRRMVLQVEQEGYYDYTTALKVALGSAVKNRFAISPELDAVDKLRFVLTWDDRPRDLDLHLVGPGFHISYMDMHSHANQARLDQDSREGHGPETITLARAAPGSSYELYVINYSDDAPIGTNATVAIYAQGRLFAEIDLPGTRQRKVPVARISNGRIELERY